MASNEANESVRVTRGLYASLARQACSMRSVEYASFVSETCCFNVFM